MEQNITALNGNDVFVPTWFYYVTGTILAFGAAVCIPTNSVVLYVFYVKNRRLRTRTTQYICALCTCDLFIATFGLVMVISSCFSRRWLFGRGGCMYYGFIMTFFGVTHIYILSAIAFDRYLVIVKTEYGRNLTPRAGIIIIICCLLFSLFWAVCPLVGWSSYSYEGVEITCTLDHELEERPNGKSYLVTMLVLCFLFPLVTIIYSYCCVFIKVVRESKSYLRASHNRNTIVQAEVELRRRNKMERDLTVTIGIMIGAFLLCWSPFAFLLLWRVVHPNVKVNPIVATIPALIAKTSITFNPVIYLYRNRPFRNTVISLIPCLSSIFTSQIYPVQNREVAMTSVTAVNERYTVCSADDNDVSLPEVEDTAPRTNRSLVDLFDSRPNPLNVGVQTFEMQSYNRGEVRTSIGSSFDKGGGKNTTVKGIFHVKPASESNCLTSTEQDGSHIADTYI